MISSKVTYILVVLEVMILAGCSTSGKIPRLSFRCLYTTDVAFDGPHFSVDLALCL